MPPLERAREVIARRDARPAFTVAICTRDRPISLKRTLRSICDCEKPDLAWELIVVENGFGDETRETVAEFREALPIAFHRETRVGLSNARNAAVERGQGEHMVWLDDDVLVGRTYLRAYTDAFAQFPEAAFFGGAITPLFDPKAPRWLVRGLPSVTTAFALRDPPRGFRLIDRTARELPFGANMAFRMMDQRRHSFDPGLGRGSSGLALGEETAVMRRILEQGGFGVWVPDADVQHVIGPERQTTTYLWRYYRAVGALNAANNRKRFAVDATLKAWRKLGKGLGRYARGRVLSRAETWTRGLKQAAIAVGELFGGAARRPD